MENLAGAATQTKIIARRSLKEMNDNQFLGQEWMDNHDVEYETNIRDGFIFHFLHNTKTSKRDWVPFSEDHSREGQPSPQKIFARKHSCCLGGGH